MKNNEIKIELQDTQWKKEYIDHDRNIVRAIVYDEKPLIYIYSPIRIVAIRNKFKNIYPTSLGGVTHNIEEIYEEKR